MFQMVQNKKDKKPKIGMCNGTCVRECVDSQNTGALGKGKELKVYILVWSNLSSSLQKMF